MKKVLSLSVNLNYLIFEIDREGNEKMKVRRFISECKRKIG
ncbi:hypothetical protein TPE_2474 [Treponema pedis str. T A4]|uniref:Uncharacterized protein n=1 Tax=Treponema pedis str. T A4 TaxID=1291379 RepID=S6A1W5_9SPIR|nr:hypothetical protein TPE_2474 [Treponema pedis str. T A4]